MGADSFAAQVTMSSASRGARAAARSLRQSTRIQSRRYASHGESHGHDAHGHGASAYHIDGGNASGNEGFGRGFYITLAATPTFYLSYQVASNPNNFVHRFVLKTTPRTVEGPPIRYPEQLNAGSPINVVAGEGTTDLSTLIKHYEDTQRKQADAADAARQRR